MPNDPPTVSRLRRIWLMLGGAGPLLAVVVAVVIGPDMLVWWLAGGRLSLSVVLIGGSMSVALLLGFGVALGWAVGRIGIGKRRSALGILLNVQECSAHRRYAAWAASNSSASAVACSSDETAPSSTSA